MAKQCIERQRGAPRRNAANTDGILALYEALACETSEVGDRLRTKFAAREAMSDNNSGRLTRWPR
jgi:hypothetical protein